MAQADAPLRVAMVAPYPCPGQPPRGGVQTAVWTLCEAIRARDDIRLQVIAINARGECASGRHDDDGVTRVLHPGGFRGWFETFHRVIPRVIERLAPDVVHIQGVPSLAARLPGSVLTIHGNLAADIWHTRTRIKRVGPAVGVAVLEGTPRLLVGRRRRIVLSPDKSGNYVPNALNPLFGATGERDPNLFVTCGELSPLKNTLAVIEAFDRVRALRPSARLALVGSGEERYMSLLRESVRALGLEDSVTFHGRLPTAQVASALGSARCLVHFSHQENAPMVVVEALASGCDVIATDVGATRLLVGQDACSRLIRPGDDARLVDAMLEVMDRDIVPSGRNALVAPFSADQVAAATVSIYEQAARRGKR